MMRINIDIVSVITVCYNSKQSIEKTILSVLNQTYSNIEYIIIDGGSTDGTVDIIKKYSDRISYWVSEPDKGIYDAMNKGIKVASGDWIHFRNSGDLFLDDKIVEEFFDISIDETVTIAHGDQLFIKGNYCKKAIPPILYKSYKDGMPVFHPSSFIRAKYHKDHLYDTSYQSSADYNFMFKCCEGGLRFEYRPICVATYPLDGFSSRNLRIPYYEDVIIRHKGENFLGKLYVDARFAAMVIYRGALDYLHKFNAYKKIESCYLKKHGWVEINSDPKLKLVIM